MSTITKERLQRLIRAIDSENYDEEEIVGWVNSDEILELARIALASLEAEASGRNPVLAYADSYRNMANHGVESIPVWSVITDLERNIAPLFTAPPAPISVPAAMEMDDDFDSAFEHGKAVGWNACRAAMLQGEPTDDERIMAIEGIIPAADEHVRYESNAGGNLWVQCSKQKYEKMKLAGMLTRVLYERPQSAQQNIPENIPAAHFKPVADLYEMQFDDGRTCAFHTDGAKAVQWLLTCDGNKVQEYVKLERYQEALSGNSPVIPDGWVILPAEPTQAMMNAWLSEVANWRGHAAGYRAMIAAAPQQEA